MGVGVTRLPLFRLTWKFLSNPSEGRYESSFPPQKQLDDLLPFLDEIEYIRLETLRSVTNLNESESDGTRV